MRFENFDLAAPYGAIVLRGLGHASAHSVSRWTWIWGRRGCRAARSDNL